MSITINGATNTLTAASGLTVAGNVAVTGTGTHAFSGPIQVSTATAIANLASSTGTNAAYLQMSNTGGTYYIGPDNSAGGTLGGGAYNLTLFAPAARDIVLRPGATTVGTFSSTGLAVTGTLSSTGIITAKSGTTPGVAFYAPMANAVSQEQLCKFVYDGGGASVYGGAFAGGLNGAGNGYAALRVYEASSTGVDPVSATSLLVTLSKATSVTDVTDATSTTAASLKTAGGLAVAKKMYIGDNIVMASGKGIDFSATSDGSGTTTSEVLSDYEEGTWTPALTWSTPGDQSLAYSTQVGTYTKVGRLVTCSVAIVTSTHTYSTATGALQISGLPFTAGVTTYEGASAHFAGITKASYTAVGLQVGSGSTVASFVASGSGQAVANIVPADVPSGTQVTYRATFSYIV